MILSGERRIEYSGNMGVSSRLRRGPAALAFIGLLASARCAAVSGLDTLDKVDCVERCDSAPEASGTIPGDGSPEATPSDAPSDTIAVDESAAMADSGQMGDSGGDGNPGNDDGQGSLGDGSIDANSSDAQDAVSSDAQDATAIREGGPSDSAPDGAPTDAGTLKDVADADSSAPPDATAEAGEAAAPEAGEAGVATTDHVATMDAYVRDGTYATTNYGAAITLEVKNASDRPPNSNLNRMTWVKFDISQFTSITSAKLRLFLNSLDMQDANAVLANVFSTPATSNGWVETMITWNNTPAVGPQIASSTIDTPNMGTWVEWDVTSAVQTEAGGMCTLVIEAGVASIRLATFSSREGANPPVLRITGH